MPGRELLSPAPSGAVSRVAPQTPQEFISPSTRRHASVMSNSPGLSTMEQENNDEAERKARRRSKLLQIQQRHLSSPATPSDRRRSANLGVMSNNQVTEHYSNCIKLSAENKINAKNAFGLHLIDYMSELLKKKDMDSFQVASSTLDASAKIYAGRVDAVHTETYKMLSGLGRNNEKEKDDGGGMEEGEEVTEESGKKRKRARKSKTIETNLNSINVNKFDLEFEVDPLFQKTSAAFDEGGTSGLLLNHLRLLDDTSELVLDSSTVVLNCDNLDSSLSSQTRQENVDLTDLREIYRGIDLQSKLVCPEFAAFEFTNWNKGEETFSLVDKMESSKKHAFDLDAETEPIPCYEDAPGSSVAGDDFPPADYSDDEAPAGGDSFNEGGSHAGDNQSVFIGDDKEAQLVQNAVNNIKHGTVGELMQVLASEPSDYSYFNSDVLQTWAGPSHWKLKAQSKDPQSKEGSEKGKKTKEKKPPFKVDFEEEKDFDAVFKESRASTVLTKGTIDKYSKSKTTLPEDLHYDADELFRLFNKPKVMVKRQRGKTSDLDDNIDNYDYDNANDRDNFCPGVGGDDDDDDDGAGPSGVDFTSNNEFSHMSQDSMGTSFMANDSVINQTMNSTVLSGDNLVAEPQKVAKIDIAYAKTAKKMDVKRLKASMWQILSSPPEEDKENQNTVSDQQPEEKDKVMGTHTFQALLNTLPEKVSKHMAKNLSVPIAFVCLLHLANEKVLKILDSEAMDDLRISQEV